MVHITQMLTAMAVMCMTGISQGQITHQYMQSAFSTTDTTCAHDWVDLGLSVRWATCNIGAAHPEDFGDYFAWGETTPKPSYTTSNCKNRGTHIGDIKGNPLYDAARANWGAAWRLPTKEECEELRDLCDWEWTSEGGHNGCRVTSKINGNSIFLPASGWRFGTLTFSMGQSSYYWGSTPDPSNDDLSCYLCSDSSKFNVGWYFRQYAYPIRPVCEPGESDEQSH